MTNEIIVSAKERILNVAGPLFYRKGYRAIGVDRVIAEAGVAKATFYKHFPSKDDLIVAWINRAEASSRATLPAEKGAEPLTDYVFAMIKIARKSTCMGCTYQGTAAEFSDTAHPAHGAALGVKGRVLQDLQRLAALQKQPDPQATAERVFLLLEGIWASVRMFGQAAPLAQAEVAFARLLD